MSKRGIISLVILSGVGLVGYSIYNFYKKQIELLKQFKWKVINLNITEIDLTKVKGVLTFRFESISDIQISVTQFYLNLSINGENVGYINDVKEFLIPAKGYSDIPFQFTLLPQVIIKDAIDLIAYSTRMKDTSIQLNGFVKVKSGFINATIPINCTCSVKNLDCNCA